MTTPQLIASLKGQGLTSRDIIDLFKQAGRGGLVALAQARQ